MRVVLLPPIVVILLIVAMWFLHERIPLGGLVPVPFNRVGVVSIVAGFLIANHHARMFRRVGTNINTFDSPGKLVTEGLFARSRNPMYLGMLMVLIGVASLLGSIAPWIGPIAFFALADGFYIPTEEKAMTDRFGERYAEYRRRVPRWL